MSPESSTAPPASSSRRWIHRGGLRRDSPRPAVSGTPRPTTADVGGYDAAAKAAILASRSPSTPGSRPLTWYREGITEVTAADLAAAQKFDCTTLLAICERIAGDDGEQVSARVYPALVLLSHPLASVSPVRSTVVVEAGERRAVDVLRPGVPVVLHGFGP